MFHNVPTFLRPSSEPWIWPHESVFTFFKCLLVEATFPFSCNTVSKNTATFQNEHFPQFSSWTKIFSFPQIDRLSSHTGATSTSCWEYWETSVTTNKQLLLQITWQTAHYLKYPYFPTYYGEISSCIFKDVRVFLDRPTQLADWRRIDLLLGILGTLRSTQQRARFKDWPTRRPERL